MKADAVERQYRIGKEIIFAVIFATGWLLRLEWSVKAEHDNNTQIHKEDKATHKTLDASIDQNSHDIIAIKQWVMDHGGHLANN